MNLTESSSDINVIEANYRTAVKLPPINNTYREYKNHPELPVARDLENFREDLRKIVLEGKFFVLAKYGIRVDLSKLDSIKLTSFLKTLLQIKPTKKILLDFLDLDVINKVAHFERVTLDTTQRISFIQIKQILDGIIIHMTRRLPIEH